MSAPAPQFSINVMCGDSNGVIAGVYAKEFVRDVSHRIAADYMELTEKVRHLKLGNLLS